MPRVTKPIRIRRVGPPCPDCQQLSQESTSFDAAGPVYVCHTPSSECRVDTFDDRGSVLTPKT